jgi:ribose/xylose/arabinose/galactoside ABC-type transport system permease subunit
MRPCGKSLSEAALAFCGVFLAGSGTAHAYIDPGSGSYALQVAVAAVFGALFSVKVFWYKIKQFVANLFTGNNSRKGEPSDAG